MRFAIAEMKGATWQGPRLVNSQRDSGGPQSDNCKEVNSANRLVTRKYIFPWSSSQMRVHTANTTLAAL